MHYVLSYTIVGLILLLLIYVLTSFIYTAPSRTTSLYKKFIICSFIGAFLDAFTVWTNKYVDTAFTLGLNNLLAVIHIAFVGSIPLVYYLFILSITHEQRAMNKKKLAFAWILYGCDFLAISTSPFTHLIMYYGENGEYLHGPAFGGTYVVICIFLIAGIIELSVQYKKISKKQYFLVLSYTFFDIVAAVYQFIHPETLLLGFSSGTSLMIINFALKSPMELIDNNIGIFNRTAFRDFLYTRKNKGIYAIVHVKNADSIRYMYGLDNGYSVIRKSISLLLKECQQKLGFYVLDNTFVFICKTEQEAYEKLQIFKKYETTPIEFKLVNNHIEQEYSLLIESDTYIIKNPQILQLENETDSNKNSLDTVLDIIQFITESKNVSNGINEIDESIIDDYKENLRIQKVVDEAIKNERFEVFLQPIYDLKKKTFTGAESLIRLRDLDGKMISPGLFIPEAEKNGKILQLGDISIKKTCEFIRDGKLADLGIEKVNINLSMVQCMQDNIVEHLIELLDFYNVPKSMIRFEITETMTATNPGKLNYVMTRLSDYGIEFALDDYGTGYSNTSRLLDFPFSEIKFDKSFVDSAMENMRNSLPLKHLMNMVNDSNMIVLVEGVETKEMSDLIERFGGSLIQGFYYAKPLPMNDFVNFIQQNRAE